MAMTLELPALGNSMEEGTITRWFKSEGETVIKGEALYEVMTDKVNIEVESPETGTLWQILAPADATIPVNGPVAILGTPDESPAAPTHVFASPRARRFADEHQIDIQDLAGQGTGVEGRIVEADVIASFEAQQTRTPRVSPLAARVAATHGVPVAEVSGSGHGGKVTHDDVRRRVIPSLSESMKQDPDTTIIKLTGMRRMVADAVSRSAQTAPHVTLTLPVDMAEATRFRQQLLPALEKSHRIRLSFTDIIAKATIRALQDHPALNSTLTDDEITQYQRVHLGIAVSLGADGLIVPVIHDAAQKSLCEFSVTLKDLAARAKAGTLTSEEVTGGTFTLTNLGAYGITQFNPIIVPPQAAILGVCAIQDTLVPINGVAQVRPLMNLCLSFDHRVTDGAPAAAFLSLVKEILEQPYLMFA
jgi:pyruvate dehydrogenase E2 component (dihydrolipoamide acetyltransferase)